MTLRDSPPSSPLTRRNVLAALGTVGVVSVGSGLGSVAYFADAERLTAGAGGGLMDLRLDYRTESKHGVETVPADRGSYDCEASDLVDGAAAPLFDLEEVSPGDSGTSQFCLHVCDNRAYLWLRSCLVETGENGRAYPELLVDGTEEGDLQEYVEVEIWYDHDGDGDRDGDEGFVYRGTLAGLDAAACGGIPLDGVGFFDDEGDDCVDLVKFEDLDGRLFETTEYLDGGDSGSAAPVPYATYAPDDPDDGHVYTVEAPDGSDLALRFHEYEFDDELTGVRITVLGEDPGYGLCGVIAKSGNAAAEYAFDCATSGFVRSPLSNPGGSPAKRREMSHITVSVCERDATEWVCFDPDRYCLGLRWSLPTDAPDINAVQGDSATFSLAFGAVQCRHNMANVNPFAGTGRPAP
jgi:hypothetical protein